MDDKHYEEILERLRKAAPPVPPIEPKTKQEVETYIMEIIEKAESEQSSVNNKKTKVGIFAGAGAAGLAGLLAFNLFTAPALSVINLGGSGMGNLTGVSSEMAGDAKLSMPWVNYTYVAGEGLSREASNGGVYQIANNGDAKSVLRELVQIFNVEGKVVEEYEYKYENEDDKSISINFGTEIIVQGGTVSEPYEGDGMGEPSKDNTDSSDSNNEYKTVDWMKPSLYVWQSSKNAAVSWSYYAGGDGSSNNTTSEEVALSKSEDVLKSLGYSVSDFQKKANVSEWGTTVTASLIVDGELTSIGFWFEYSGDGVLRSVSGQSFSLVKLGDTELISAYDAANTRAGDWRYYGQPYYDYSFGVGIAAKVSSDASTSANEEANRAEQEYLSKALDSIADMYGVNGSGEVEPSTTETDAPVVDEPVDVLPPVDEYTEPEEVEVTLSKSKIVWLTIYDTKGVAFIVKGYELSNEDKSISLHIIAVPDSLINLPKQEDMVYSTKDNS